MFLDERLAELAPEAKRVELHDPLERLLGGNVLAEGRADARREQGRRLARIANVIIGIFAKRIVMHRILTTPWIYEYWEQKPCLDYWMGRAQERGLQVVVSDDSVLGKPFPWQPRFYGYETVPDAALRKKICMMKPFNQTKVGDMRVGAPDAAPAKQGV